jgi:NADPH-dependent 2,4-dienoyl-CoA reductase/sulfur reductase-like enzyme
VTAFRGFPRRRFLGASAAMLLARTLGACANAAPPSAPKVVVVGGGYGGATAARYLRLWSGGTIDVTLVERDAAFVSCPLSNLVIGGSKQLADITVGYGGLEKLGVRRIRGDAVAIEASARTVALAQGETLPYDRLILAPGVDFVYDGIPGLRSPAAQALVPHAWKAGPQTVALRARLEAMHDGGVFAIHVPRAPYRCPPGPYERACQVANYFLRQKPKSKVIILDANEEVQSKKALFTAAWSGRYRGYVEYRPNSELVDVDPADSTIKLDFEEVRADVINVIPPQRAGAITRQLGIANANGTFCQVDFLSYESTAQKYIHVLGDAIQTAPLMPKSGHMANQHGKVCAAAVVALLSDKEINPSPLIANACYSYIDDQEAAHIASVHAYDREQKTMLVVPGSGGLSSAPSVEEAVYAEAWARNIWFDMLG